MSFVRNQVNGWRKPSGAVPRSENSFAGRNSFGMEEWLFNYEWLINEEEIEYEYGYLTPISKYRKSYEGQCFSAALYAIHGGFTLLVAEISKVYVPYLDELTKAFNQMTDNGWVDQMKEDIASVNGRLDALGENRGPYWLINIRFNPNDVTIHDPMHIIDGKKLRRYAPYDWNGNPVPVIDDVTETSEPDDPTRSELPRKRAAQGATMVDPKHVRLQNSLFLDLRRRYGNDVVRYEHDHVDLKVLGRDGWTFYEIKTDITAKRCLRSALGQLLEYSSYPTEQRARRLVVVGDAPATQDDRNYLCFLRQQYTLPIFYSQFNWNKRKLGPEL